MSNKLPAGPQTHPWIQTYQWVKNPLGYMEECAKKYGDTFTLRVGPLFKPQVLISHPQGIQQIFTTDPKHLDSGAPAGAGAPLLGPNSLLSLEGKTHQRQRKLLTPQFHGERMLTYGELINDITKEVTSQWQIGEVFPVLSSMQEISFQVILKAVFGLKDGERCEKLKENLIGILNPKRPLLRVAMIMFPFLRKDLGTWSPWGRYLQLRQQLDELIYAEIQERRCLRRAELSQPDPSRTDILSLMMAIRDEAGEPMTDIELRDELMTLLVAGHETTASSLAFALYWIHSQPGIYEKLLAELDSLGENPDPNAIFKLPYLNAVCSETLRFYPVAMVGLNRLVKSPLEISGYKFETGTIVIPCIYLTHHREDLYPDPQQFKPERFLERQFTPYEFLPFGGGNRRCIGMAFALFEMKLVLANVLSNWHLELAETEPVKPIRKGLLLGPDGGVNMIVKGKRLQNQPVLEKAR
ncbi:cytochrome P450 [Anabaena sp. UHCC 0204]|uniref:cytochrome P450 n=1 Tax=Anabaena sp. UHCC 0204 TaxID=2590009 RepID=UPI001444BBF5|nr:cytochrome P450 [Anabaena sp. UHCC 0204]MTJ07255.1 cytochrome P450 [Anabaena sp. UHCC 0204]